MQDTIARLTLNSEDGTEVIEIHADAGPDKFYQGTHGSLCRSFAPEGLAQLAEKFPDERATIEILDAARYAALLAMPANDLPGNELEQARAENRERWVPNDADRRSAPHGTIHISYREIHELHRRQAELGLRPEV